MTKKRKQSSKATKSSKRRKVAAQPEEEPDTATAFTPADASQATQVVAEGEISTVELQEPIATDTPFAPVTESGTAPKTRSETAKANIKEGLKQHALAGRPTKAQLILVFGQKGYAMTWAQRTERFGITPETFQAALAKGVPAIPLTPVAKPTVEKPKGTA